MSPAAPARFRRYRLLVRAYPPGPRRAELLDTMLMVAEDTGRRRPSAREVVNVLRHAPRARLGRPGNRLVVLVAVLVSILSGFVAASLTARALGETDRPLPGAAEMATIAGLVTPDVEVPPLQRHDGVFVNGNGEAQFGQVRYETDHAAPIPDLRAYDAEVADRLTAAGWRLGPTSYSGTAETLTATRDGWLLTFSNFYYSTEPADGGRFEVSVRRVEPTSMPIGFAAGGLLGMVFGWFLTGWASRRTEHSAAASGVLALLAIMAAGNSALLINSVVRDYLTIIDQGFSLHEGPIWSWTVPGDEGMLLLFPTILATIVAGVILAVSRRPRGTTPHQVATRSTPARVGWTLILVTFGLGVLSACTGFGLFGFDLLIAALLMAIGLTVHRIRNRRAAPTPVTPDPGPDSDAGHHQPGLAT
ncbi:hypothetical protein O7623_12430 [Solwaraspora sp. WMMD791]|uniref:hypothetical protein n=1 Tax=Solwaraspora sp. WMMD791 TaxID=3016086 RepID=UPI00249A8BEF|nr:hypothetical protein [Solwaraspora sp. WMMD791]WFE29932.1 hypothetical protein O7623_12430 [Solwaraspora sp. WMMD791]